VSKKRPVRVTIPPREIIVFCQVHSVLYGSTVTDYYEIVNSVRSSTVSLTEASVGIKYKTQFYRYNKYEKKTQYKIYNRIKD